MYLAEGLQKKWAPVLDHEDMPKIKDPYRKAVTAVLLENQEKAMREQASSGSLGVLSEAPTNNTGDVINNDPVLISMIRSTMPNLIAYDVCGVQPMTGPTGLIFAMRAKYDSQDGADQMYDEVDPTHSGAASPARISAGTAGTAFAQGGGGTAVEAGLATGDSEGLGSAGQISGTHGQDFQQMAF